MKLDLIGKRVRWTSQSGGFEKAKEGVVLDFVVAGDFPYLPGYMGPQSRIKFDHRRTSKDRYIVAVKRPSGIEDYYAPLAHWQFEVLD